MLAEVLQRVMAGETLTEEESSRVMQSILTGEEAPSRVGALLAALALRGETVEELAGMAVILRNLGHAVPHHQEMLLDTCGTGGDGSGTFNVSTVTALVAAGAGLPVAKHGNRAATSRCGSADVLEELGVNLDQTPAQLGKSLDDCGIAFLYAPALHPVLARVAPVRRQLGFRTVFNLLGPLVNPAGAHCQLLGVHSPHLTEKLAAALERLGTSRALVVCGRDGLDEVSLAGSTRVTELSRGCLRTYDWEPAAFGLEPAPLAAVRGGTPRENAAMALDILEGRPGAPRDLVLINAAAALLAAGAVQEPREGVARARRALDSGAARARLQDLVAASGAGDATCS